MRVAIEAPGRWLPITLDAAVHIAGPVARVIASSSYPDALRARAERTPQAFVPALLLEHRSGAVTSLVTLPHAWPGQPVRVVASFERGRVEASLPRGGARVLACRRGGALRDEELVAPSADPMDSTVHGRGMRDVARSFADAILGGPDDLATLEEEAHLRRLWTALWRAAREHEVVDVEDAGR